MTTPFLGLNTWDTASGSVTTFLDFRLGLAGNSGNMSTIDNYLNDISGSITGLVANRLIAVEASQISTNYYESTVPAISTYVTNMAINLKLNTAISGSASININGLGTKTLKKTNSSGSYVQLVGGDIYANQYTPFVFNGTDFILIGSTMTSASISTSGCIYTGSAPITVTGSVISHNTSGVVSGSYNAVLVNSFGHIVAGSVVSTGTTYTGSGPITVTGSVISHNTSGIVSGSYNTVFVDSRGHVTSGSIVSSTSGCTYSGSSPVLISGSVISLQSSGVTPGNYLAANITVDHRGIITSASNGVSASSVGAPSDSPFITSASSSNLNDYRIITAGSNIMITTASYNGGPIIVSSASSTSVGGVVVIAASDTPVDLMSGVSTICDGIDDQSEINQAINVLSSGSGGIIRLLPGNYKISSAINFNPMSSSSAVSLVFDGMAANISASGSMNEMVMIAPSTGSQLLNKIKLSIGLLDGKKSSYTIPCGVRMHRASDNYISIGAILDVSGDGFLVDTSGISDYGTFNNFIDLLRIAGCGQAAIVIEGNNATPYGFQGNLVKTGQIIDNHDGIVVGQATNYNAQYNNFYCAPIEHNTAYGIYDRCGKNKWIVTNTNNNGTAGIGCPSGMTSRSVFITHSDDTIEQAVYNQHLVLNNGSLDGSYLSSGSATNNYVLTANGSGGTSWKSAPTSGSTSLGQGARVYNNSDVNIGTGSLTTLTFNSENFDTDTIHSTSSNTERLTCNTAGKYLIIGQIMWEGNANGIRYLEIDHSNGSKIAVSRVAALPSDTVEQQLSTIYDLAVNDYVVFKCYQSSGVTIKSVSSSDFAPVFSMQRIG